MGWVEHAACKDSLFDFFSNDYWEVKACVLTCYGCPVRIDCLTYALNENLEDGVWGGVKGGTLNVLRYLQRRGRLVQQLTDVPICDWSIGGEWEQFVGWDYPHDKGRNRGDQYTCHPKR